MIWFVVILGVWNVIMSFLMNTKNVASATVFKVVPFVLGAGTILYCLKYFGVV